MKFYFYNYGVSKLKNMQNNLTVGPPPPEKKKFPSISLLFFQPKLNILLLLQRLIYDGPGTASEFFILTFLFRDCKPRFVRAVSRNVPGPTAKLFGCWTGPGFLGEEDSQRYFRNFGGNLS